MTGFGERDSRRYGSALVAGALLVVLVLAFWKLRMVDAAVEPSAAPISIDVGTAFYPRTVYAFGELSQGRLPLWNPYQLLGTPQLATPATGIFYPLNLVYVAFPTVTGIEISLVLHAILAAIGMLLLCRRLSMGWLAGTTAAIVFVWSGPAVLGWSQPVLHAGAAWFPWTGVLLLGVLSGSGSAWVGLVVAVAVQWFIGATEVTVHCLQASALLALVWIGHRARTDRRGALAGAAWLLSAVVLGTALAAVQLVPSIEMVGESVRAPGGLGAEEVSRWGIPPLKFLAGALELRPVPVLVGLLPLVGVTLGFGARDDRRAWLFAIILTVCSMLLVFGGDVFRLYASLPGGTLFRRPMKFVDLYGYGAALLSGLAIQALVARREAASTGLWRRPAWILAPVATAVFAGWGAWVGGPRLPLALPALLVVFGTVSSFRVRSLVVLGLVAVQAVQLFLAAETVTRPWHAPELYQAGDETWKFIRKEIAAGGGRAYTTPSLRWIPHFMPTQGAIQQVRVLGDYQPLTPRRYEEFALRATAEPVEEEFSGAFRISTGSKLPLLDLMSLRFVVVRNRAEAEILGFDREAFELRRQETSGEEVYERASFLPRVYRASRGMVLQDPVSVLDALDSPDFDPTQVVVLEEPAEECPRPPRRRRGQPEVAQPESRILVDEPGRVVVETEAEVPGFLVLGDLFYPGWHAYLGDRELPLRRVNYLLRAVCVPKGRHEVHFVYEPRSLRIGAAVTAFTLLLVLGVAAARSVARKRATLGVT